MSKKSTPSESASGPVTSRPYVCPVCTGEEYYGRLVFSNETEPAVCSNKHKQPVLLVPALVFRLKQELGVAA